MYSNVMNEQPNVNVRPVGDVAIGGYTGLTMTENSTAQHQYVNSMDNSKGTPCSSTALNTPQINSLPQYQQQYQMNGVKKPNYPFQQYNSSVNQVVGDLKSLAIGGHNIVGQQHLPYATAILQNQRQNISNPSASFYTSTPEHSTTVPSIATNHPTAISAISSSSKQSIISPNVSYVEKVTALRGHNTQTNTNNIVGQANYYSSQTLPNTMNRIITNGDLPSPVQGPPIIPPQIEYSVPFNTSRNTIHGKRYPNATHSQSTNIHQQSPPGKSTLQYQQPIPPPTIQQQQQQQSSINQVHTQQPLPYEQSSSSVITTGFNRLWNTAAESFDLLQTSNILPPHAEPPPEVQLPSAPHIDLNCNTEVFRCTLTRMPESASLLHKSRLPLGVLIHPFKDLTQLAVIQCSTIVRCRSCRTYINPFVYFVDNKRWKCNLCYRVNELPEEFQYDPVTKTYGDPSRRPEVRASTIEYIAPAEYMLRPPQPAVYLFLLDISRTALESGYLHTVCSVLLDELDHLPGDARTQLGFLAFDTTLHFFSLSEGSASNGVPHEMIVWDIDDPFLPCPDNLLVNLQSRKEVIRDLLQQLPNRYANSYESASCLGAALQAAHKMMAGTGGRMTVFQAALPTIGPGALTAREDPNLRAGSSGATQQLLNPANDFYKRLALECSGQQIAVDLFLVNSQYVDVATVSGISKFSGGTVYQFPLYKATSQLQQKQLSRTLKRYLTRKIGFEAVMRVRCSRGLSIHAFHGHFFVRSTDLLSLPNVSPDAAFGMQVAIEESLADAQTVCFQAALLYTSSKAERRIRVHTLCIPVANTLSEIIHSADQQAILSLLAKMAVDRSISSSLSDAKDACVNAAIDILTSYKLSQNLSTGGGSLMAPKCLRLLPLYIAALLRHPALRVGVSTRLDDRVKAMCDLKSQSLHMVMLSVYPDLYPVHNIVEWRDPQQNESDPLPQPPRLQLSARSIDRTGAYLMDCGMYMMLLVCPQVSPVFVQSLALPLGSGIAASEPPCIELPESDNDTGSALRMFIDRLNEDRSTVAPLLLIREDIIQHRQLFLERLVEDRLDSALSYHEFLQHLRSQVK